MSVPDEVKGMVDLLDRIRAKPGVEALSLEDVMARIGTQSFPALLLVIGVLMVSPLSSIPFLPALLSIVIVLTAVQAIMGRKSLWLPQFLMKRQVKAAALNKALDWLGGSARWLDRRRSGALRILAYRPFADIGYAVITCAALTWPPLSLVPMSTTIIAVGMTLIAAGLTLREGLFLLAGYLWLGLLVTAVFFFWTGIF